MNDNEIVELFWNRDESAILKASEKYSAYCHSISYSILKSNEDAEECVNDTWLGAWKSIPPKKPENLAAYLGKITRNLSINRLKLYSAKKRGALQIDIALSELEDCIPDPGTVEQEAEKKELASSVSRFLYKEPEQKRNIFVLRYWYLYSVRDIARKYGMSESRVASMLFRMRKALKAHLEKEGINI